MSPGAAQLLLCSSALFHQRESIEHIPQPHLDTARDQLWQPTPLLGSSASGRGASKHQFCTTLEGSLWHTHTDTHGAPTGSARNNPASLLSAPLLSESAALLQDRGRGPGPQEEPGSPVKDNAVSSAGMGGEKVLSQAEMKVTAC